MISSNDKRTLRLINGVVNASVVLLVLAGVFIGLNWQQMPGGLGDFLAIRITVKNLFIAAVCLVGGATAFHVCGLTQPAPNEPARKEFVRITMACTVTAVFALLFPLTSNGKAFDEAIAFYFLPVAIVACLCGRLVARAFAERFVRTLDSTRELIIVGSGPRALAVYNQIREKGSNQLSLLGFVDSPEGHHYVPDEIRSRLIGSLEQLEDILMQQPVDEVLIALPAESCFRKIQSALTICERAGVEARYSLSDLFALSVARPRLEPEGGVSVMSMKVVHDDARVLVKRAIDIVGAVIGLIIFAPLMLLIAAAIRLTSPGAALFVQERYGFRKRRFPMFKFRTMVRNAEELQAGLELQNEVRGPAFKIRKDPRITPLGRILRKTSMDELPQLFNVLRGTMSLVGPRPLPIRDVSRFSNAALMRRFSVKPGLTCLWQINGRSNTDFDHWIKLDLQYIDEWSLGLDMEILLKTVPAVFRTRGAV
ncbi:MAG: sugar transferase [Acidobacteriota bacterium]|nr:sugar transferase [Acidobacteriota bacterium]